jgi:hypothetical protein
LNRRNLPRLISTLKRFARLKSQLVQLDAAFSALDAYRSEEAELVAACEQVAAEEKVVLEQHDGSEKQAVDRLLKVRALKDIRQARLTGMRKKITLHVDMLIHDVGSPLRHSMSSLAYGLLNSRSSRIQKLYDSLLGVPYDSGLPIDNRELTRRSKPVIAVQQLCNWIHRESRPTAEEELSELRSEVPRRWLSELRGLVEEEC